MVLDGKFIFLDPYLGTNFYLLSDIKSSKIEIVDCPILFIKNLKKRFLSNGVIKNKKNSNYNHYLKYYKYKDYLFITKTLQIYKEKKKTEESLSKITKYGNNIIYIFFTKFIRFICVVKKILQK
jgi:hypothetical protein